ncbi:MAG: hypothetical protein ACI97A_004045 [Planctomycetota bacterium]|jgi:hypothetical protein
MWAETRVVDNRTFLFQLDSMYRDAMKVHERGELLQCAREVADGLGVQAADDVPIEGYYAEDEDLTEYFRLMRSLQDVKKEEATTLKGNPSLERLVDVTSSPLFGIQSGDSIYVFPPGRDSLFFALADLSPKFSIKTLVKRAREIAIRDDDASLVGLAAFAGDAVMLTALRESVVLYAEVFMTGAPKKFRYSWKVDKQLSKLACRFVENFNALFNESLPEPTKKNVEFYWGDDVCSLAGRCVRIAIGDSTSPGRHYHWAIERNRDRSLRARGFWDEKLWTTEQFKAAHFG